MRMFVRLAAALALVTGLSSFALAQETTTVFGAASVTNALEDIGTAWREQGGGEVQFSFASSSVLARQIEAGAPAAIFVSANEKWMDYLDDLDLIVADTRVSPIGNRLVLIAPAGDDAADVDISEETDLAELLGEDGRLAVGNPEHVPAGIYAQEALESLGMWETLEPRLARADNVRAALGLVETGEAPLGIVYSTDAAISEGVKVIGTFPASSHKAITYPFAVMASHDTPEARELFDFMTSPQGLAIFAEYGFATD